MAGEQTNIYEERLMEAFSSPDFMIIKQLGEKLLEAGMAYVSQIDASRMLSPSYIEPALTQGVDQEKSTQRY